MKSSKKIRDFFDPDELTVPDEVVGMHIMENKSLLCAWREYKNISPAVMAKNIGMSSAEYLEIEKSGIIPESLVRKTADCLGIAPELLMDT
ncbi:MAG: helix-turn-helix domain-containing protein [Desulfococcaceae bacterium]